MAYVTPITWSTGTDITAARLNQNVRDNVAFLATPPSCRVYNSSNISHSSSGSYQYLTFNNERYDTDTMHSTSVNTGRITFTTAGKYHVGATIEFASNATGVRGLVIRLNGTTLIASVTVSASSATQTNLTAGCDYQFSAADYVEVGAYQSSGGSLNVSAVGNTSPEFWAHWFSL